MHLVNASTSAGSTAGNIAIRSWLRPSLRYGSVSTMPFARSTLATAAASTESSKSIVPTTAERLAGSETNGVAYGDLSAQPYRIDDDSPVRETHQSRPPRLFIHSIWSASRNSVASAGVLYVWSRRLLSNAMPRSYDAGTQRSARTWPMRSIAAGDIKASQRPPSEAKHFCGAK